MAAMGTLVVATILGTFLLYSAVLFYVLIMADNIHWIIVTVHRYSASRDCLVKKCTCISIVNMEINNIIYGYKKFLKSSD
jgi:hypothetical protein